MDTQTNFNPMRYAASFQRDGYYICEDVILPLDVEELRHAIAAIPNRDEVHRKRSVYGVRNLLEICPAVCSLAAQPHIRQFVTPIYGDHAFAVRAVFFDKGPEANWSLFWHQDNVIAVARRLELPGYLGWSQEQMIEKANTLGGLSITKNTRGPDKPATNVTWNEAARFVNWLNTSSGSTPAYKFAIQPGEVGYSPNANIQLWTPTDAGYNPNNLYRNSLARYFLPSVHEWYKAAYYDPTSGVYYDYPTGSDSVPDGIDFAGDPNFDAVFFDGAFNPQPNDITNVGLLSPYGTAGQGGNVYEWEETDVDLVNDSSSSQRGFRGGFWGIISIDLLSSTRRGDGPAFERSTAGFRVASNIPEPSTLLLGAMASLGLLWRRALS